MRSHFHLAYNIRNLDDARRFYGDVLGCREGRSAPTWVDVRGLSCVVVSSAMFVDPSAAS